jgi:hypothetical protein
MLDSIAKLGDLVELADTLSDPIKASNILSIQFTKLGESLRYESIELEEKKEDKRYLYLYRRDKSGKPGLFLSWRISSTDVKKLKKAVMENDAEKIREFEEKKIKWFACPCPNKEDKGFKSKLKILRDSPPAKENKLLQQILNAFAENIDKISCDLKEKILAVEKSPELLITIKIIENGKGYYPGDYLELAKLLEEYVMSVET